MVCQSTITKASWYIQEMKQPGEKMFPVAAAFDFANGWNGGTCNEGNSLVICAQGTESGAIYLWNRFIKEITFFI
jgi:hypothetical protein